MQRSTNKDELRFPFRGLIAPVFTPFDEDQNVNVAAIKKYAEYLHSSGVEGILVNGTVGEGMSLTAEERMEVLETWIREAKQYNTLIVAQIGGTNIKDVKNLARHAESCKVSGILCLPDLYFKPKNVNDLLHYLNIVSAEAPHTPLLYYHIPSFTGIDIDMNELLSRRNEVPTLAGVKFTDTDLAMAASCAITDRSRQTVLFLGADTLFLSALFMGIDSAILTCLNIFPNVIKQILKCYNEKDYEKAIKLQQTLNSNIKKISDCGPWVSSMKAAMSIFTPVDVGPVRDPLEEVDLSEIILDTM